MIRWYGDYVVFSSEEEAHKQEVTDLLTKQMKDTFVKIKEEHPSAVMIESHIPIYREIKVYKGIVYTGITKYSAGWKIAIETNKEKTIEFCQFKEKLLCRHLIEANGMS